MKKVIYIFYFVLTVLIYENFSIEIPLITLKDENGREF